MKEDDATQLEKERRKAERRAAERRSYRRFSKHFLLSYYDRKHPQEKHSASQLRNISMGGMCLITAKYFDPFTILVIELKTPFHSDMTLLVGEVIQSEQQIKDVIYETHLQFIDLNQGTKEILEKLIAHLDMDPR